MRILIVSFMFPPYNIIGAVRVGKTAKYLRRLGHEVSVLTAADLPFSPTLELEIPESDVRSTRWRDVDAPYQSLLAMRRRVKTWLRSRVAPRQSTNGRRGKDDWSKETNELGDSEAGLAFRLRLLYLDLFHFPDSAAGWKRSALSAGRELIVERPPDVIFASGAPWTSLVVASKLSRDFGVPWVAELRDLWADNPDILRSQVRARFIDARYERRVLNSAAALITVTEPLADRLRREYPDKAVHVVLNGFDAEDYEPAAAIDEQRGTEPVYAPTADEPVRLVYTGQINRDLEPLITGVALLGDLRDAVRLEMVGVANAKARAKYTALAEKLGVADQLVWLPTISHIEASRVQRAADVLFLVFRDSANDACIYTGKLFEYIGARRPILIVGITRGVAAQLIRERGLGVAAGSPQEIAEQLRRWIDEKRATGRIRLTGESSPVDDLTRETQTALLSEILTTVSQQTPGKKTHPALASVRVAGRPG